MLGTNLVNFITQVLDSYRRYGYTPNLLCFISWFCGNGIFWRPVNLIGLGTIRQVSHLHQSLSEVAFLLNVFKVRCHTFCDMTPNDLGNLYREQSLKSEKENLCMFLINFLGWFFRRTYSWLHSTCGKKDLTNRLLFAKQKAKRKKLYSL